MSKDSYDKLIGKGSKFYKHNKFREALWAFHQASALDPTRQDASLWFTMGQCHKNMGELEPAISSYDKCLVLEPNHMDCWYERISVLMNLKRTEDALASCDKYIALNSTTPAVWYYRGRCLRKLLRYQEAVDSFENCLKRISPDSDLYGQAVFEQQDILITYPFSKDTK